jgi:hypothetical protein
MFGTAIKVSVLSLSLLPLTVLAQNNGAASAGTPGCGDDTAKFEVKTDKGQHLAQPETGKALVYFIENDSNFKSFPKPTTRAGVDGKWVGATHGNSYLYFSIDPGVHHLCASWQFGVILGQGHKTSVAHFTAEAGGVYYFEVKNTFFRSESSATTDMDLTPLDSDEGQILANKFALSTSQQKK